MWILCFPTILDPNFYTSVTWKESWCLSTNAAWTSLQFPHLALSFWHLRWKGLLFASKQICFTYPVFQWHSDISKDVSDFPSSAVGTHMNGSQPFTPVGFNLSRQTEHGLLAFCLGVCISCVWNWWLICLFPSTLVRSHRRVPWLL